MSKKPYILCIIICFVIGSKLLAQNDTAILPCSKYLKLPFVSDGQQYKALAKNGETAEFNSIFYGGSIYRIIACSNIPDAVINITIKDVENNILYNNKDFKNAPYWDFKFMNTMDCKIEAKVSTTSKKEGQIYLMIGFRQ